MEKFSKDKLKAMGLTEEQIAAIANQSDIVLEENKRTEVPTIASVSEITTITNLSEYAKGNVVRLPDFSEGQPFVARIRRPSLLVLMKSGKIPNTLLKTASDLFEGRNGSNNADSESISKMYDVMKVIAEASLISPTMQEITDAGIELTDEQLIAIFNYSQRGVNGLQSFRE